MKIAEDIFYIGADDTALDLFESQYPVPTGMAYNSYLIRDDKLAIMDTADERVGERWKQNLSEALDGRQPDYLVVQHMEPDHSALIAWALERYPELQIVATAKALQIMGQFFDGLDLTDRSLAVKEGDTLPLGRHTLRFLTAPMVHWPEVMVSYEERSRVLFSADAFGKFGALGNCGFYGDEDADWAGEGRRYYFNSCGKYGAPVQTLLGKVATLDVAMIAPLHGPVLRENLGYYVGLYDTWSRYAVETEGVLVACASIHGGTKAVAEKLVELLQSKGAPHVAFVDLTREDPARAVEAAFRYGKLIVCAASYDAGLFPPAFAFIHHLQDKAWQKRRVGLVENGSWAPSAGRVMKEMFAAMKEVEIVEPHVTIRSRMKAADMPALEALADAML